MYSCSYGMRNLVLLICFKSSIVLCIGPYLFLLFRMCTAYADWGLLFLMYRVCSWCCNFKLRFVCPMYALWQVLHVTKM
jgi:hypothetical protein